MNTSFDDTKVINSHTRYGGISFLLLIVCFGFMMYLTYQMLVSSGHPMFSSPEEMQNPIRGNSGDYLKKMLYVTGPIYLFSLIFLIVAYVKKETHAFKYIASVFHVGILGIGVYSFLT